MHLIGKYKNYLNIVESMDSIQMLMFLVLVVLYSTYYKIINLKTDFLQYLYASSASIGIDPPSNHVLAPANASPERNIGFCKLSPKESSLVTISLLVVIIQCA
jgi:hypothetical protein